MGSCQSIPNPDVKGDAKNKGKPQILIKAFTWARDSHGLFDYECKTLTKKTLKSMNPGRISRKGHDVVLAREGEPYAANGDKDLLRLHVRDGNYWVGPSRDPNAKRILPLDDAEDNENSLWMVVKSFKSSGSSKPGYRLHEGDLMKLGRIKFRVKELRGSGNTNSPSSPVKKESTISPSKMEKDNKMDDDQNNSFEEPGARRDSKVSNGSKTSVAQQTCRICLGEQADADDPFFSPCHCSGTMRYIHVMCLQRWLKSKLHKKETDFSTSIYWKTLECELCKKTYPSSFEVEGRKYDIVEVERPKCGYLMMEVLSKEKNILRGIHIIKMEGKSNIKLGRGHDSDIRITDISVSRCHAIIRLEKGNFFIEDNNSKFGTLVHMRKPFALNADYNNISLQIGRTVLSLSVKKNWKALSNCFGDNQVGNPIELEEEDLFTPLVKNTGEDPSGPELSPNAVGGFLEGNVAGQEQVVQDPASNEEGEVQVHEGEDDRASDMPEDEEDLDAESIPEDNENIDGLAPGNQNQAPAEQASSQRNEQQNNAAQGEEELSEERALGASAAH